MGWQIWTVQGVMKVPTPGQNGRQQPPINHRIENSVASKRPAGDANNRTERQESAGGTVAVKEQRAAPVNGNGGLLSMHAQRRCVNNNRLEGR